MENSLRKDRLLLSQNFALYYGHNQIDLLSRFDMAIVEPKGQSITNIKRLKVWNTLVISYLSFMEVHPTETIFEQLSDDDFLRINNHKMMNKEFGTYLINLKSKRWIQYLIEEIHHRYNTLESDGIFMDTIGDIDGLPEEVRKEQLVAITNFLFIIKTLYPKHLIIQNNGLEHVILQTSPYIDGVCWENPPVSLPESREWVCLILERLLILKENWKLKILYLLEETVEKERKAYMKARKIAKENDFLLYSASKNYVEGVYVIKG
jgi:hypothetical protein